MMKLINGLIFGAGLGLVSASASGIAGVYAIPVFTVGAFFILAEIGLRYAEKNARDKS